MTHASGKPTSERCRLFPSLVFDFRVTRPLVKLAYTPRVFMCESESGLASRCKAGSRTRAQSLLQRPHAKDLTTSIKRENHEC